MNKSNNEKEFAVVGVVGENHKDKTFQGIELRSGEVQELMKRPPSAILKCGISVILIFVLIFIALSFYIKYPSYINVQAKLFPSSEHTYVCSPVDGKIIWICNGMQNTVNSNDTLAGISYDSNIKRSDTIYLRSNNNGNALKIDVLEDNMHVVKGQQLFLISKQEKLPHKIYGSIYVNISQIHTMKKGLQVDVEYNNVNVPFVVTDVGRITNNEGKYPICICYNDSVGIINDINPIICNAKITVSNKSVFDTFIINRINILHILK